MVRDLTGKHPNYYEAILQLRDASPHVTDFANKIIKELKLTVAKVAKLKTGVDFFLSDNELTRRLGKRLQQHFGGELTTTSSLHTKKDGKELFRVTVLFRPLPFKKGEKVEYQEEEYCVKATSKDIFLQHTKTGKKLHVRFKDMKHVHKKE